MSSWPTSRCTPSSARIRQRRVPSTSRSGLASGATARASVRRAAKIGSGCTRVARSSSSRSSRIAACVRSCGRTLPRPVRLGGERDERSAPLTRDAVGTDVVLDAEPRRRRRRPARGSRRRATRGRAAPPRPPTREASGGARCTGCGCRAPHARPRRRRRTGERRGPPAARPRRSSGRRGTAVTSAIAASVPTASSS